MFTKYPRFVVLSCLLALILNTLACGMFPSAQPAQEEFEAPAQAPVTEEPSISASGNESNPGNVVPCTQILSNEDAALLLNNTPATLSENAHSSGSICSWQYTPNGSTETHLFYLEIGFGPDAATAWEMKRSYEVSQEPADIVVNGIDGLGDESYVWSSQATGFYVVFARRGDKTLIMRYIPQDALYMANESGIIDMADRFFSRY